MKAYEFGQIIITGLGIVALQTLQQEGCHTDC